jgi:hypothetical protein
MPNGLSVSLFVFLISSRRALVVLDITEDRQAKAPALAAAATNSGVDWYPMVPMTRGYLGPKISVTLVLSVVATQTPFLDKSESVPKTICP